MAGMMTVFAVREGITTYEDPGWYQYPPGTVASEASVEDLKRDGIQVENPPGEQKTAIHSPRQAEA
jgi:manganese oxidase